MAEIIIIKLRVEPYLASVMKHIAGSYDIDRDIIDLTTNNINIVSSVEESTKLGHALGDLIELLSLIKEKSTILKN